MPIRSGASLNVGTITARKTTYYRAHLSVQPGDCAPGEKWTFSTTPVSDTPSFGSLCQFLAGSEFLVRNLAPGSYSFALSTSARAGEQKRWAVAPVEVTDRNLEVALTMSLGTDISGRLVTAEGVTLPLPRKIMIDVSPVTAAVGAHQLAADDADGKFLIRGLPGDRHRVSVSGLSEKFYVKEIRYNGLACHGRHHHADGRLSGGFGDRDRRQGRPLSADRSAERDKLAGTVVVAAVKWPASPGSDFARWILTVSAMADDQGRFQISGLAPGEYRVLAMTRRYFRLRLEDDSLIRLLERAPKR